jgi:hypothetical protein
VISTKCFYLLPGGKGPRKYQKGMCACLRNNVREMERLGTETCSSAAQRVKEELGDTVGDGQRDWRMCTGPLCPEEKWKRLTEVEPWGSYPMGYGPYPDRFSLELVF